MALIKLLCVNDQNRPEDIPLSHWIKEGVFYTLKDVKKLTLQGGILGVQIDEIDLTKLGGQHEFFALTRFGMDINDLQAFKEVIIASSKQDSISSDDLNQLFDI